jgi:hypothetical protein
VTAQIDLEIRRDVDGRILIRKMKRRRRRKDLRRGGGVRSLQFGAVDFWRWVLVQVINYQFVVTPDSDVEQSIKVCPARIVFTKIHTDSGNITPRSMLITFPSKLELDAALEKLSGRAGFSSPTGEEVVANSNQGSFAESSSPTG